MIPTMYGEMVDFGESNKMIKINAKKDKSDMYNVFSSNISFFIPRIKNEILLLNPL